MIEVALLGGVSKIITVAIIIKVKISKLLPVH